MERPFQTPGGVKTGVVAIVLAGGLGALFLPGMPAALVWPYEWLILLGWAAAGFVLIRRIPRVGRGPGAHEELVQRTGVRRESMREEPDASVR